MKLTHLVGSQEDLEDIAAGMQYLGLLRERSTGFINGRPGVAFLPVRPDLMQDINSLPELQDEWAKISPLYYHALAIHNGRLPHVHAQLTPTSVAPSATSYAPATSPQLKPGLVKSTYATQAMAKPEPAKTEPAKTNPAKQQSTKAAAAPKVDIAAKNIRIAPTIGVPEKLQQSSRNSKKPEVIHPALKDGWKAWVTGLQSRPSNRPGGQAPTYNKLNPITDADRQLSDEKAPNRGFHFYPSNLNLLWDEDPHLCRGIFDKGIKCLFANEPTRCQYRHYVHQETLDFVVTKRGVNTEFIKWMFTNYMKNTPASVRKVFEQEAGKVLQVLPDPSAFEPPETTKSSAQREQRHPPAATANAAATEAASHPTLSQGLSLRTRVFMSEEQRERWGDHEHKIQRDDMATRAKREEVKKVEGPAGIPQLNETYKNDGKTILTVHPAQSATSTEPEQAPSPPRLPRKASVLSWSSEDQEPDDVRLSQKVASENPNLLAPSGAESGPPKPDRSYLEE